MPTPLNPTDHPHTNDADCSVDPATDTCRECSVVHGDPCPDCGGAAFHTDECCGLDVCADCGIGTSAPGEWVHECGIGDVAPNQIGGAA